MRRLVIAIAVLLCAGEAAAQEPSSDGSTGGRHFGAPVLKYTTIRDQKALMFGGRGGWNVSPTLVLGIGAYGTLTEVDADEGVVPAAPGPLDVKLETFGFDVEYAPDPGAPTHLTFTAFLGGAANHYYKDGTNDQHGETDFSLLLEPSVGVEQRVTAWLHLNLSVSYRLMGGVEQVGLKPGDFQVASAALAAKFGRF
jgi:hypothetical protein